MIVYPSECDFSNHKRTGESKENFLLQCEFLCRIKNLMSQALVLEFVNVWGYLKSIISSIQEAE
jgi:hypothetical protein